MTEHAKLQKFQKFFHALTRRKVVWAGLLVIALLLFVALAAGLLSPYNPNAQDLRNFLSGPTREHLLGTDALGRDVLSRIIHGSRVSLTIGLSSILFAGVIGMTIGLIVGYFEGPLDSLVMRFVDAQMAIPPLVQAMAIGAVMGGGFLNVVVSIGFSLIPTYVRLMRGQVLSVKHQDYINAGIAIGCRSPRLLLWHIFPNCLSPLIVLITQNLGSAILTEANLSFLGLGIAPPQASWGAMVNDGYAQLLNQPILSFAPGICVVLVVLAFNMVGDGVRDALDPRLRGVK